MRSINGQTEDTRAAIDRNISGNGKGGNDVHDAIHAIQNNSLLQTPLKCKYYELKNYFI